jgi:putative membrane protein insertion efficiency factor
MTAAVAGSACRPRAVARALVWLVRIYQAVPRSRPAVCRYQPTCSQYAIDAVGAHGAWRGGGMALRRLGRCHPWGGSGWDPVPTLEDHDV